MRIASRILLYASKVTENPQNGSNAFRLEAKAYGAAAAQPGFACIGKLDMAAGGLVIGEPYTKKPESLKGYFRISTSATDSVIINIELVGTVDGDRIQIGTAQLAKTGTAEEWTEFNMPIQYLENATPDTILLAFSAGNAGGNTSDGTFLELDNLVLEESQTYTEELSNNINIDIYPNPISDVIYINSEENYSNLAIYDAIGHRVFFKENCNSTEEINISDLNSGLYFIRLKDSNNKTHNHKLLKK